MNRGNLTPRPESALRFGLPGIQQAAGAAAAAPAPDNTTPGALIGCIGAPRTAIVLTPYQPAPWLPAVGA